MRQYSPAPIPLPFSYWQGNKESGSEWMLYGTMLYRHADDQGLTAVPTHREAV
jgi:hypothetical protein